jgi:hypothetical protein
VTPAQLATLYVALGHFKVSGSKRCAASILEIIKENSVTGRQDEETLERRAERTAEQLVHINILQRPLYLHRIANYLRVKTRPELADVFDAAASAYEHSKEYTDYRDERLADIEIRKAWPFMARDDQDEEH